MVTVVQLVRASDCGSECRGFESHRSPFFKSLITLCCEGFFCLSTSSPSHSLLSARSTTVRQDSGRCPLSARSLSSCLAFVVAAVRAERLLLIGKVPPAYLPALARAPMPVAAGKRFAPLHRRMRSGANRQLGWGSDAQAPMRFSKRLSGLVETYISSREGACAHRNFRFLPSPFTFLRKVQ